MVYNIIAKLCQAVNIGFSGSKIAPFYRVIKKPPNAVAIILVILGGIDTPLSSDAMRASRGILNTEGFYMISKLSQAGRS